MFSCEQQRDRNGILSERVMVDVLYDYQLAMSLATENAEPGQLAELEYRYAAAVFHKHQITEDEFNLSIAHYVRDPKAMLAITEKVSERLTGEAKQAQAAMVGVNEDGTRTDTTVVWQDRTGFVLTANGNNRHSISIPGHSVKPCERLLFGFKSKWIYREGGKSGGVVMSVTFDNDSVGCVSDIVREFSNSQGISITVPKGRKIKHVDIQLYQSARWQKYPQVMSVNDLSLWGISTTKVEKPAAADNPPKAPIDGKRMLQNFKNVPDSVAKANSK